MTKKLSLILCVLLLTAGLLSACSANSGNSSSDVEAAEAVTDQAIDARSDSLTLADILDDPQVLALLEQSGWSIPEDMLNTHNLPEQDTIDPVYPDRFFTEPLITRYERQQGNACGGYAAAFFLRSRGIDAAGEEIYDQMEYKITDGLILPQGVLNILHEYGQHVEMYQGSLDQLKARLAQGDPVVVLIGDGHAYVHYVTLVGYDAEGNLYFFDSNLDEDPENFWNSTMTEAEFEALWNNGMPYFERLYFAL